MKVKLQFTSSISQMIGIKNSEIEVEDRIALDKLLEIVKSRYGNAIDGERNDYQWRHGSTSVEISINDRHIRSDEINMINIKDGDRITFFPPLAGG